MLSPSKAQNMLEILTDHVVAKRNQSGFDC